MGMRQLEAAGPDAQCLSWGVAPTSCVLLPTNHAVLVPQPMPSLFPLPTACCRSYLDVDRSLLNVSRDDPDDPGNQELV